MKTQLRCNVAELVAAKGCNIEQFARGAGISRNTARALIRQEHLRIDLEVLQRVAVYFGVAPGDLLTLETLVA